MPRLNRPATAQPPAKAAPNTSAPIRTAALSTVDTLVQLMRRFSGVSTVWSMGLRSRWPPDVTKGRGDQEGEGVGGRCDSPRGGKGGPGLGYPAKDLAWARRPEGARTCHKSETLLVNKVLTPHPDK